MTDPVTFDTGTASEATFGAAVFSTTTGKGRRDAARSLPLQFHIRREISPRGSLHGGQEVGFSSPRGREGGGQFGLTRPKNVRILDIDTYSLAM